MAKKSNKQKAKVGYGLQVLLLFVLLVAILFMPTTILLLFGMLPTVVAAVVDRGGGTRALTVGAMNLAGCVPFLLELWTMGHSSENSMALITDPRTIIVMYSAAAIGYLIDWALSGIVATLMISRATARLEKIRDRQDYLVERWGREVTGELPLDPEGFPLEEGNTPEPRGAGAQP